GGVDVVGAAAGAVVEQHGGVVRADERYFQITLESVGDADVDADAGDGHRVGDVEGAGDAGGVVVGDGQAGGGGEGQPLVAAAAGVGGRRGLGGVGRGAGAHRLDDVVVGGVAGQAGVGERRGSRGADLGGGAPAGG